MTDATILAICVGTFAVGLIIIEGVHAYLTRRNHKNLPRIEPTKEGADKLMRDVMRIDQADGAL